MSQTLYYDMGLKCMKIAGFKPESSFEVIQAPIYDNVFMRVHLLKKNTSFPNQQTFL